MLIQRKRKKVNISSVSVGKVNYWKLNFKTFAFVNVTESMKLH